MIADEEDSAHSFAKELKLQIESYFAFALNSTSTEFLLNTGLHATFFQSRRES